MIYSLYKLQRVFFMQNLTINITLSFGEVMAILTAIVTSLSGVGGFLWKRIEKLEQDNKNEISAYNKMYLELINKQFESAHKMSEALEGYEQNRELFEMTVGIIRRKLESEHD